MYIHVNVNRRSDLVINRNKLQMDRKAGFFFHFLVQPDAVSPLIHQMKTHQLKNARVEMRYERNLFAVLYALGLSANLFYLTNDSLAPLSPPPLPLALSISSTFLPSLLSLSLWARRPSTRLSRSFSLLHLARLLS